MDEEKKKEQEQKAQGEQESKDKYIKIAIVGRANVGKSTLMNALCRSNVSVVWPEPYTTRDVVEAVAHTQNFDFIVCDTAGFRKPENELERIALEHTKRAIEDADAVIVVFDAKTGITQTDWELRDYVLRSGKPAIFVVNKVDSDKEKPFVEAEFAKLGVPIILISALHRKGLEELERKLDEIAQSAKGKPKPPPALIEEDIEEKYHLPGEVVKPKKKIRIAFIGRPNVGKSSIINAILNYPRCIVYEEPGTTRDAVRIPFRFEDTDYILVDTPGIRRKSRIEEGTIEFKSVGRTITALEVADVCILVIDSVEGVTRQDKRLASLIERRRKPLVVALNKMDIIKEMKPAGGIRAIAKSLETELHFVSWAIFVPTSAVTRDGVDKLLRAIKVAYYWWSVKLKPSELEKIKKALEEINFLKLQRPKVFQVRARPPWFLVLVKNPEHLSPQQIKHIEKAIRKVFPFRGSSIVVDVRRHGEFSVEEYKKLVEKAREPTVDIFPRRLISEQ